MSNNMNFVTAFQDTPHVSAMDDGALNAGIFGEDAYILNIGEKLRAELVSANQVRIFDGGFVMQGRFTRIDTNTYVDLAIDNGTPGNKRNDLVCVRYEKDSDTGIESANLIVIKGTESASTPEDPEYNEGNIFDGDLIADFPLYRIKLDGITVDDPELIAQVYTNGVIRGDNANGHYTKLPDGTLIQWNFDNTFYHGGLTTYEGNITYPVPFVGTFAILVTPRNDANGSYDGVTASYYGETSTGFTARLSRPSSGYIPNIMWMAIGRWK